MANGATRNALAEMQIKGKSAQSESEILKSYDKKEPSKIPLKNSSEHNHSK